MDQFQEQSQKNLHVQDLMVITPCTYVNVILAHGSEIENTSANQYSKFKACIEKNSYHRDIHEGTLLDGKKGYVGFLRTAQVE